MPATIPFYEAFWLEPNGTFHQVSEWEEHDSWAATYLDQPYDPEFAYGENAKDLYKAGWYRGVASSRTYHGQCVSVNGSRPLTARQKDALEMLGIEHEVPVEAFLDIPGQFAAKSVMVYTPPQMSMVDALLSGDMKARQILEALVPGDDEDRFTTVIQGAGGDEIDVDVYYHTERTTSGDFDYGPGHSRVVLDRVVNKSDGEELELDTDAQEALQQKAAEHYHGSSMFNV